MTGIVATYALAYAALLVTAPFHNPDDGANLAAVWGFLLGPPLAGLGVGLLARRRGLGRDAAVGLWRSPW